jgi:hypothetical protein
MVKDAEDIIILIELGNLSQFTVKNESDFIVLYQFLGHFRVVLSLSSGSGNFSGLQRKFLRLLAALKRSCRKIEFLPFTRAEFKSYRKACPFFPLDIEVYESITNFNPLLLSIIIDVDEVGTATTEVNDVVKMMMAESTETLLANNSFWVKENFSNNMNMLIYAMNGTKLQHGSYYAYYCKTWLYAEKITYINFKDEDKGIFALALNFPTCYDILMSTLRDLHSEKTMDPIRNPIIDGYFFEHAICSTISSLNVAFAKTDEAPTQQSNLDAITFNFCGHVSQTESNLPVVGLVKNVLYSLRPCHPVIDAVAYVEASESPWLVLVQVSLSDYKSHKSKLCDLKNGLAGVEKRRVKSTGNSSKNWLEYYRSIVPADKRDACKCMYVYISPEEYIKYDARKKRFDLSHYNLRYKESFCRGVYFGLILKGTDCAQFITLKKGNITYY